MNNKAKNYVFTFIFLSFVLSFIKGICIENNIPKYKYFDEIPKSAGVYSWLPDFFPTNSKDITIFTDVESDSFYSDFNLDEKSSKIFDDTFTTKASLYAIEYINKSNVINVWYKKGDSIDGENRDSYNSLYLVAKLPENKYHILLVKRGENTGELKEEEYRYCVSVGNLGNR